MRIGSKISIRELVEFVLRHGSIDNRNGASATAVEGIRAHQRIQKGYGEEDRAEVPLRHIIEWEHGEITVEGRADGILKQENGFIIDEIKTTLRELDGLREDFNDLHWAQAKCYAYIFAKDEGLERMSVQLTYCNVEEMGARHFLKEYSFTELESFFTDIIEKYKVWVLWQNEWMEKRNTSLQNLNFPFPEYRPGQRDLAVRVYKSIEDGNNCFAQAPTGIGKTISTLFPTLKAMGQGHTSKIFYLTAKTITREVAEGAITNLEKQNLSLKSVTLTAKEKVCKMEEVNCNPEYCKFAAGHFDRVNDAIEDALQQENTFNRSNIDALSEKHCVCPFEFALDLTLFSDVIICDYNYLFDPKVYLKRFFERSKTDFTFLIDEAHNLIDRGRDMYSASLNMEAVKAAQIVVKGKDKGLSDILQKLYRYFATKKNEMENSAYLAEEEPPTGLYSLLEKFVECCGEVMEREGIDDQEFLTFFFDVHTFLSISGYFDERYKTVYEQEGTNLIVRLLCVDPSHLLQKRMKLGRANVVFSATLLPLNYFATMFGATENDYILSLKSPFSQENRCLMVGNKVSTTYRQREETVQEIVEYISACANSRIGNYMVFFPSYAYMEMVYYAMKEKRSSIMLTMQERNMTEQRKEDYLEQFQEDGEESKVGFCVLGSHFSEGIDLANDRLIGVIVVGVGMPQMGPERDMMKDYFNEKGQDGFIHSYVYPGMIKVLQAAGRCIRTDNDRGIILLLDYRYGQQTYQQMFPAEWYPHQRVSSPREVEHLCGEFWR